MTTYEKLLRHIAKAGYAIHIQTSTLLHFNADNGYWAIWEFDKDGNAINSSWGFSH